MPKGKSKEELVDELTEAQEYIEQLENKLDDIAGVINDKDEEDSDEEDDESDEDDDDEEDDDLD